MRTPRYPEIFASVSFLWHISGTNNAKVEKQFECSSHPILILYSARGYFSDVLPRHLSELFSCSGFMMRNMFWCIALRDLIRSYHSACRYCEGWKWAARLITHSHELTRRQGAEPILNHRRIFKLRWPSEHYPKIREKKLSHNPPVDYFDLDLHFTFAVVGFVLIRRILRVLNVSWASDVISQTHRNGGFIYILLLSVIIYFIKISRATHADEYCPWKASQKFFSWAEKVLKFKHEASSSLTVYSLILSRPIQWSMGNWYKIISYCIETVTWAIDVIAAFGMSD